MSADKCKTGFLSACTLKILACVFMVIDHVGVMFYPQYEWMRIVGRLAYPLFAYFIAEGCRYTKNKAKRFLSVFILCIVCELFYIIFSGEYYGNILLTFSIAILLIYLLQSVKKAYSTNIKLALLLALVFALCVVGVYYFCESIGVDYGFFGIMTPVLVTLFDDVSKNAKDTYNRVDKRILSLCGFSVGLVLLSFVNPLLECQKWCLMTIPLLLMYSGEKGKYNLKYGFYLFYPLHMVILEGVYMLVNT